MRKEPYKHFPLFKLVIVKKGMFQQFHQVDNRKHKYIKLNRKMELKRFNKFMQKVNKYFYQMMDK